MRVWLILLVIIIVAVGIIHGYFPHLGVSVAEQMRIAYLVGILIIIATGSGLMRYSNRSQKIVYALSWALIIALLMAGYHYRHYVL